MQLSEAEEKVLRIIAAEPDVNFACYYDPIVVASGSLEGAYAICQRLRQTKLVTGHGRGWRSADYTINDKGMELLKGK